MAVYAVTGKLGAGKGKGAMYQMRRYLQQGKRVATNMDVFLEHLGGELDRQLVMRVPDKPTAADLYMIGSGNKYLEFEPAVRHKGDGWEILPPEQPRMLPGFDEAHNGALFLDECSSWLNTRNFQDKDRAGLLEYMIHARKYGWDVYFICQNVSQIDKQLRDSLFEYVVRMNRMDRMRLPVISDLAKAMTAGALDGNLPRLHIGVVRLGASPDGLVADRWYFRGDDLQPAYNTTQVFSEKYPHAIHCLMPSWHLGCVAEPLPSDFVGPSRGQVDQVIKKYRAVPKKGYKHMGKALIMVLLFGLSVGAAGTRYFWPRVEQVALPVPTTKAVAVPPNVVARGFMRNGGVVTVFLSDGTMVEPRSFREGPDGWEAQISDTVVVKGGVK